MSTIYLCFLYFYIVKGCEINKTLMDTIRCKSGQIVDMSVSVVRSDQVLFEGSYTNANHQVTTDTVFQVASLSKAFASTLLVKLIEENKRYTLDTKLATILNNKDIFNDSLRSHYVTVRDLLTHKTGIPQNNRIRLDNNLTRHNLIHRFKYLKSRGEFRGSYMYSSLLYGIVTYITELIGGDSWENLVKKHLFDPLGMTSSTFVTTASPKDIAIAAGYIEYYGELHSVPFEFSRLYGELCGSGCVLTSAHDMTKWMTFFLNGGKVVNGSRLISEEAFNNIITPVNVISDSYTIKYFSKPTFPVTNSQIGYALGWRIGFYRGYKMIIHTGATYGYRAMLSWYPDVDLAIFTVMTGNDPDYLYRQTLHNYIFDTYSGYTPYLNVSTICSYPRPWVEEYVKRGNPNITKDIELNRPRKDFCGVFYNQAYGYITVQEHKENNRLTLIYGYVTFILYPKETKDEFYGDSVGISVYLFNFYTFKFHFTKRDVSLEIPNFERKSPPFFYKPGHICNGAIPFSIDIFVMGIINSVLVYMYNGAN